MEIGVGLGLGITVLALLFWRTRHPPPGPDEILVADHPDAPTRILTGGRGAFSLPGVRRIHRLDIRDIELSRWDIPCLSREQLPVTLSILAQLSFLRTAERLSTTAVFLLRMGRPFVEESCSRILTETVRELARGKPAARIKEDPPAFCDHLALASTPDLTKLGVAPVWISITECRIGRRGETRFRTADQERTHQETKVRLRKREEAERERRRYLSRLQAEEDRN